MCIGAGGSFGSVMEHYPHNGTQQMNGLLPPIPGSAEQLNMNSIPSFNEHDLAGLNGMTTLEPLPEDDAMGAVITSGFESALNQRRSNSGSQVYPLIDSCCPFTCSGSFVLRSRPKLGQRTASIL